MHDELKAAIATLAKKASFEDIRSDDAMKFAQAALSLAHALEKVQDMQR